MKHVRIEEKEWTIDSGDMPNFFHNKEPMVSIVDGFVTDVHMILPIRLLREFISAYDEAQKEE